jgi:hypothetical protein
MLCHHLILRAFWHTAVCVTANEYALRGQGEAKATLGGGTGVHAHTQTCSLNSVRSARQLRTAALTSTRHDAAPWCSHCNFSGQVAYQSYHNSTCVVCQHRTSQIPQKVHRPRRSTRNKAIHCCTFGRFLRQGHTNPCDPIVRWRRQR